MDAEGPFQANIDMAEQKPSPNSGVSLTRKTCQKEHAFLSFHTAVKLARGVANLREQSLKRDASEKSLISLDSIPISQYQPSCKLDATRHFNQIVKAIHGDKNFSHLIFCRHKSEVFKMTQYPESNSASPGFTLLQCATILRRLDIMESYLLLEDIVDVNQRSGKKLQEVTALHLAAQANFTEGINLLLNSGAEIDALDSEELTSLHHATLHKNTEATELLIERGASLKQIAVGYHGFSALSMVLRKTPKAIDAINKKLDASISVEDEESEGEEDLNNATTKTFLKFDFSNWQDEKSSLSLLHVFAKEHTLEHPLLRVMLNVNWERAKFIYYVRIFFGVLFLAFITSYVLTKGKPNWQIYVLLTLASFDFVRKAVSFYSFSTSPTAYKFNQTLSTYLLSFDNYCEIACYLGVLLFWLSDDALLKSKVGPIVFLAGWFKFIVMIGEFPIFGLYIDMYYFVVKSFVKLICSFSIYLLGFIICFYMYFENDDNFSSFYTAIVKVAAMMVGELEYGELAKSLSEMENATDNSPRNDKDSKLDMPDWYRIFPLACILIFIVAVPIVLMSLLLGIVVQDVNTIKCKAHLFRLARQAELVEYSLVTTGNVANWFKSKPELDRHGASCDIVTGRPISAAQSISLHETNVELGRGPPGVAQVGPIADPALLECTCCDSKSCFSFRRFFGNRLSKTKQELLYIKEYNYDDDSLPEYYHEAFSIAEKNLTKKDCGHSCSTI